MELCTYKQLIFNLTKKDEESILKIILCIFGKDSNKISMRNSSVVEFCVVSAALFNY